MKTVFLAGILAKMAMADLESIMNQVVEMAKANNASIPGTLGAQLRNINVLGADNREFVDPIRAALQPIYNYGCWCHFGTEWVHAGGKVQDSIDGRCKQLINGYRCAKMDGNARGEDCDAGTISYTTYNYFGGGDLTLDCQGSNPNNICAQDACIIEGSFTLNYLVDIVNQNMANLVNPAFQAANGWDRAVECPAAAPAPGNTRACCGAHPNRAPYSTSVGTHDCCTNTELFSVATQACCIDPVSGNGVVQPLGSC